MAISSQRDEASRSIGSRLIGDRSFADNHCLATDPHFFENSGAA
jgi:hypothetical protein